MVTAERVSARDLRTGEVFVALGSNLGDRASLMRRAYWRVLQLPEVMKQRRSGQATEAPTVSGLYETLPVAVDGKHEPFLNAAMRFHYDGGADRLLAGLHGIEADLGRRRGPGVEPRTIDLDLLCVGADTQTTAQLTLPHPRMHERLFVLVPICDFAAEVRHPGRDETFGELRKLAAADTPHPEKQVRRIADAGWIGSSSENGSTGNE